RWESTWAGFATRRAVQRRRRSFFAETSWRILLCCMGLCALVDRNAGSPQVFFGKAQLADQNLPVAVAHHGAGPAYRTRRARKAAHHVLHAQLRTQLVVMHRGDVASFLNVVVGEDLRDAVDGRER